jgi:hypothetical protein
MHKIFATFFIVLVSQFPQLTKADYCAGHQNLTSNDLATITQLVDSNPASFKKGYFAYPATHWLESNVSDVLGKESFDSRACNNSTCLASQPLHLYFYKNIPDESETLYPPFYEHERFWFKDQRISSPYSVGLQLICGAEANGTASDVSVYLSVPCRFDPNSGEVECDMIPNTAYTSIESCSSLYFPGVVQNPLVYAKLRGRIAKDCVELESIRSFDGLTLKVNFQN